MKVQNMTSSNGNKIANQFIIETEETTFIAGQETEPYKVIYFQSHSSIIVKKDYSHIGGPRVFLDKSTWDHSVTTGKYRNQFLGETKKETQKKIASGEYILADLN